MDPSTGASLSNGDKNAPNKAPSKRCSVRQVRKGKRSFRMIYSPSARYREELRLCLPKLEAILAASFEDCADHAFVKGRNVITGASQHLGKRFLLTLDIESFFDSITATHLNKRIDAELLSVVLEEGAPRQGLPTSPIVANIAMIDVDSSIKALCKEIGGVSYSRYADDLAFGFDAVELCSRVSKSVEEILLLAGFRLNSRKTRLQNSANGAMHITGVALSASGIRPTRSTLRRIRAARHQGRISQATGLAEWAKCKVPKFASHEQH